MYMTTKGNYIKYNNLKKNLVKGVMFQILLFNKKLISNKKYKYFTKRNYFKIIIL
jgi:hypothetical protein